MCIIKKQWNHVCQSKTVIPTGRTRPNSDANWPYRNSLTGSCALCHIRVFDLLCLSNQLGLVSLGSCSSSQAQRPRTPCSKVSLRMPRDIPFKAWMFELKRRMAAGCSRPLKQMRTVVTFSKDLAAGTYRVTLVVNGALKTSINNTTLEPGESTQLNFDLTQTRASVTVRKGIHRVWIPAFTGSRLPGRWVEVDDGGAWAAEASANNIVRVSGEELQRTIHSLDIKRGQ